MIKTILSDRPTKVLIFLTSFFVANALIAECIGGKIFSLEDTLGISRFHINLFGEKDLSFMLTCGVLLWPLEFVMTDIVNEYYGPKAVKRISWTAIALISYAFIMFYLAIIVSPYSKWDTEFGKSQNINSMQTAFSNIFGQGMWIILGSLTAFLVSQLIDVTVFHRIKKATGEKWLWLRATGSTLVSQLVDSFIVLFIAFKIGNNWTWSQVLAICLMNYIYKFTMAILLTPVVMLIEKMIERYVGHDTAKKMKRAAMGQHEDPYTNIPTAG